MHVCFHTRGTFLPGSSKLCLWWHPSSFCIFREGGREKHHEIWEGALSFFLSSPSSRLLFRIPAGRMRLFGLFSGSGVGSKLKRFYLVGNSPNNYIFHRIGWRISDFPFLPSCPASSCNEVRPILKLCKGKFDFYQVVLSTPPFAVQTMLRPRCHVL